LDTLSSVKMRIVVKIA